jgi:superfamily II DNA or RNA helicase/HKD family nuclease
MARLPVGLYDTPITQELRQRLEALEPGTWDQADLAREDAPAILARLVHDRVVHVLRSLPKEGGVAAQVGLTNQLIEQLVAHPEGGALAQDRVALPGKTLLEVGDAAAQRLGPLLQTTRPSVPLRTSEVLMNGRRDVTLAHEVRRELASADHVGLLCSFLKHSGFRLVEAEVRAFLARRPGGLRILTTTYMGATERRALDAFADLGAQIRVSYDQQSTRLHAKAWLFHRHSGLTTGFIGSSNLSAAAMLDGLEWNVRLSAVDNPALLEKFAVTFEQYWAANDFEPYDPVRFDDAVHRSTHAAHPLLRFIDVKPRPHQQEALDALDVERAQGHTRNLVVAATGTGKTVVAALDYRRLCKSGEPRPTLLFVAHRKEILVQARDTYRAVLREADFGDLLVGDQAPARGARQVFASIQSLASQGRLLGLQPDAYGVLVVDEFHHAEASTYAQLLEHLKPKVLLGLTATPERSDGLSVLHWFDGRVASELRLWKALDDGLLSPFQYFGVSDGTSLKEVRWLSSGYDPAALEKVYTADHVWCRKVLSSVNTYVTDPHAMRALGFCVTKGHADFMATQFSAAGLPSAAVVAETSSAERQRVLHALSTGELRCVFCVDVFNEGVDLPNVDTLLFLRPTESATLFLQQLGRGLRRSTNKTCLTVLDFIGDANRKFSFVERFRALLGGTRRDVERSVDGGFPRLPPGCAIRLEQQAQEAVLANIRGALDIRRAELVRDLRAMGPQTKLATFLNHVGLEPEDLYKTDRTFTQLRREAGFEKVKTQAEEEVESALQRLLHVDDFERLDAWRSWLAADAPVADEKNALQRMLMAVLGQGDRPYAELSQTLQHVWSAGPLRAELVDLLGLLADRVRRRTTPLVNAAPFCLHGTYSLDEIAAGFDARTSKGHLYRWREGVRFEARLKLDLLNVTLDKSLEDYSPSTMYDDRPLSARTFQWQSQSNTAEDSPTGQRYVNHVAQNSRVMMFVRQRKRDARGLTSPYVCLGYVRYVSHQGSRPMTVTWELEREMPSWFFQETKIAAA